MSADHPSRLWKRPPPVFATALPFFAIFGPARGQIYKKCRNITKKYFFCFFWGSVEVVAAGAIEAAVAAVKAHPKDVELQVAP